MSSLVADEGAGAGEVGESIAAFFFFFRLRLFFFGVEGVDSAPPSESQPTEIS